MKMNEYRIGFVGFGHMAQALFKALDLSKVFPRSHILFTGRDPKKKLQNEKEFGITASLLPHLVKESRILLLAVRPPQMEDLLKELKLLEGMQDKMVISIAAGIQIPFYQKILGPDVQIARVMPNLAVSVAEGMSVISFSSEASEEFRSVVQRMFSSMGLICEVPEKLMDVACATAGSGPGFVFRLIEAMARFGEKEGISYPESLKIAAQVFAGASRLILKGESPQDLIHRIAVPGGTTEAGLKFMQECRMEDLFHEVLKRTEERSKSLSK